MTVTRLWVERYRSLARLRLDLHPITLIQGENATGKTNLYRVLQILSRGADGRLATTLLAEGGMPSALSAGEGTRGKGPVRMVFGVCVDDMSYELSLGLPAVDPTTTPFHLDAEIKEERAWIGTAATRHSVLLDRSGVTATARDADGEVSTFAMAIDRFEPALAQLGEPARFPELFTLRERMRRWRFYHQFASGRDAPARLARAGVRTPVLADDGHDLAAALATIYDLGSGPLLDASIDDAFPGARLHLRAHQGVFDVALDTPGVNRPLSAQEWSDGTLRYLCLVAALLSPRPPELLVLNEPETSLHGSLLEPLARLVLEAGRHSQIVITTHAPALAAAIADRTGQAPVVLSRTTGTTTVTPG